MLGITNICIMLYRLPGAFISKSHCENNCFMNSFKSKLDHLILFDKEVQTHLQLMMVRPRDFQLYSGAKLTCVQLKLNYEF